MSEIIIGIDLGTTNSCVAVHGVYPDCYVIDNINGYSVVTDRLKRKFTPSVLAYTGNPDKPFEIGHNAKRKVEGKYPPVMFAKRDLGTDKKYQIDDDKFITPMEVSAEILKYLRQMAEIKLGKTIQKAVVTVPAYFDFTQKSLTRDAILKAGFVVDDERYILQEPVAAALTYTQTVSDDSLKIMVYDLGGGTFDISIVRKESNLIEVVKFGGDHALGGYDFDKLVTDYILKILQETGYQLDLNIEKNTEDRMRYVKLLLEAEQAKIVLSNSDEVHLRKPAIFEDQSGELVDLDLILDRPTFESLISEKINYTVELCRETLDNSGFNVDQIDKILMVGGSTYIPLVAKRLKEEFGKEPQFLEPDLCVAIGASVQAAQFGIIVEQDVRLKFEKLPSVSTFDREAISGKVTTLDGKIVEDGYAAEISNAIINYKESQKLEEGNFYFEVPLQLDCENNFTIKIYDNSGKTAARTQLKITHSSAVPAQEVVDSKISGTVNLSKTIYLKTESDLRELAPEGAPLPYEKKEEFKIAKKGEISETGHVPLNIELYEQDLLLGVVSVTDIPWSIGDNDPVIVGIKVTSDFQIIVSAELPTVGRDGKSVFSQNIEEIKSKEFLKKQLNELCGTWEELKLLLSQDELAKVGVKINRLIKRAKEYFAGQSPDTTEVSKVLNTLSLILKDLRGKGPLILQPSKDKFDLLCEDTRNIIKMAEKVSQNAKQMAMERTLDILIDQGKQAYASRNQKMWKNVFRQVEELCGKAANIVEQLKSGGEAPDPNQLLMSVSFLLNEMRDEANAQSTHKYYSRWIKQLAELQKEVKELSKETDKNTLLNKIREIYMGKISPLRDEIHGGPVEDAKIVIK